MPFDAAYRAPSAPATWTFDNARGLLTLDFAGVAPADGEGVKLDYLEQPSRRALEPGVDPAQPQALIARELDAIFTRLPPGASVASKDVRTFRLVVPDLTPAQADAITRAPVVQLEGRVAAFATGAPNRCSLLRETASTLALQSRHLALCSVALSVETIRFETAEGRTLKLWSMTASPAVVDAKGSAPRQDAAPAGAPPPGLPTSFSVALQNPLEAPTRGLDGLKPAASSASEQAARQDEASRQSSPTRASQVESASPAIRWAHSPEPERVEELYPQEAFKAGRGGEVELLCLEEADGRVRDCRVLSEAPVGEGFGRAALRLSTDFRLEPVLEAGRPVQAWVHIPYAFQVIE